MNPITRALISVSILLSAACSSSTGSVSSEIEDLLAEFDKVLNAMDTDAIMSFYADDIVILAPDEAVIEGSDAVRVWTENTIRDFVIDETHFPIETIDQGDVILHRGDARGSMAPRNGEPAIPFDNKYIHIYRREPDGSLKMIWGAFNANPPE